MAGTSRCPTGRFERFEQVITSSRPWYFVERAVAMASDRAYLSLLWLAAVWIVKSLTGADYLDRSAHLRLWQPGAVPGDSLVLQAAIGFLYGLPIVIFMAVLAAYVVSTAALWGRTPGMHFAGLRLVTREGTKPGVGRLLVWHAVSHVSGLCLLLGYLWCLVDRERRTWHDIAAGVRVVRVSEEPEEEVGEPGA